MKFQSKLSVAGRRFFAGRSIFSICVVVFGVSAVLATAMFIKSQRSQRQQAETAAVGVPGQVQPIKSNKEPLQLKPAAAIASGEAKAAGSHKAEQGAEELRTVTPTEELEEKEGAGRRRIDWFYYQRAYPAETIPTEAGFRMREQLASEETRLSELRALRGETAAPEQLAVWAALGPAPIEAGQTFSNVRAPVSGRVTAIALDPGYNGTTNQTVYVGAA